MKTTSLDNFLKSIVVKQKTDQDKLSGQHYMFLIDISGSMTGERTYLQVLSTLGSYLNTAYLCLKPNDKFNIVLFSDSMWWYQPTLSHYSEQSVIQALEWVKDSIAEYSGGPDEAFAAALESAVIQLSNIGNVVVLTDGDLTVNPDAIKEFINLHPELRITFLNLRV